MKNAYKKFPKKPDWMQKLREKGYPYKIIGNDHFPATLVGVQRLLDGEVAAVYRYPGGDCVHSLEDMKCFEILER